MSLDQAEIKDLKKRGYKVEALTPYQFRVESILDLYPKRQRFHNIRTQERGHYIIKELPNLVKTQIAVGPPALVRPKQDDPTFGGAGWWVKYTK